MPKSNLADAFADFGPAPRLADSRDMSGLVLVGANLSPSYARNLALLHAETGRTKKELIQEALDMLFRAKGGRALGLKI
jgi:hypothetical protein